MGLLRVRCPGKKHLDRRMWKEKKRVQSTEPGGPHGTISRSPDFRVAVPVIFFFFFGVHARTNNSRHAYSCPFGGVYLKLSGRVCRCESRAWQRRPEVDRRHGDNQRPASRSPPPTSCSAYDTALVRRLWWERGGGRGGSRNNRPSSSSDAAPPEAGRGGAQGRHVVGRTRRCVGIYVRLSAQRRYLPDFEILVARVG